MTIVEDGASGGPARRATSSVPTYGLTHLALAVWDPARAFAFYSRVFGMVAVHRDADFIQPQTPGARDVLVLEPSLGRVGTTGAVAHFGFRLTSPTDIDHAVQAVREAGGTVVERGEFVPNEPFVFFRDLDGYLVEVWYELPTPADPSRRVAAWRESHSRVRFLMTSSTPVQPASHRPPATRS
jgi:catechol 2,3-dioxygenase-like lactoylglutathione lyase family enzyme